MPAAQSPGKMMASSPGVLMAPNGGHHKASSSTSGVKLPRIGNPKITPGPGQYTWNPRCHKLKEPEWSMFAADRAALPPSVGTWVPQSSAALAAAPPPGHYGDLSKYKPVGGRCEPLGTDFAASKVPRQIVKAPSVDKMYDLKPVVGPEAKTCVTMKSMDRATLGYKNTSWVPEPGAMKTPGPGAYDLAKPLGADKYRRAKKKYRGTFGGRPSNLPFGVMSWTPETYSIRLARAGGLAKKRAASTAQVLKSLQSSPVDDTQELS